LNDSICPSNLQLATLREQIVYERHTEGELKAKKSGLQKEAAELTTYLKQNQDVSQTLVNVCQRSVENLSTFNTLDLAGAS